MLLLTQQAIILILHRPMKLVSAKPFLNGNKIERSDLGDIMSHRENTN